MIDEEKRRFLLLFCGHFSKRETSFPRQTSLEEKQRRSSTICSPSSEWKHLFSSLSPWWTILSIALINELIRRDEWSNWFEMNWRKIIRSSPEKRTFRMKTNVFRSFSISLIVVPNVFSSNCRFEKKEEFFICRAVENRLIHWEERKWQRPSMDNDSILPTRCLREYPHTDIFIAEEQTNGWTSGKRTFNGEELWSRRRFGPMWFCSSVSSPILNDFLLRLKTNQVESLRRWKRSRGNPFIGK